MERISDFGKQRKYALATWLLDNRLEDLADGPRRVPASSSFTHNMMRRCHSSAISSLLCLSFFIAFLLFAKHVKQRFEDMQKLQRLQNYMGELNLVSDSLEQLEVDENALALDVGSLKELFLMTSDVIVSDESSAIMLEKPFHENSTIIYS